MILAAPQVRAILAGRKTQMRVPVREPGKALRKNGTTRDTTPFRPHIGRPIVISQPTRVDGKDTSTPVCNVLVTHYEHALLHNPTPDGVGGIDIHAALAEGHKTSDDFKCWWVREHDRTWVNAQIKRLEIEPSDDVLVERFEKRHTLQPVWVITFKVQTAEPGRVITSGRGDDYKILDEYGPSRPARKDQTIPFSPVRLVDEPQAVDEQTLNRFAADAREMDALRAAGVAERDLDRLRALDVEITHWKTAGPNLRDHVRQLQRGRAGLERRLREQVRNRQQAA